MTPPDAMSWDEAVAVLLRTRNNCTYPLLADATAALAAIQSHRVQAEADAVDAARWRWLRDHHIFGDDSMQELWFSPYVKPLAEHPPGDLDKSVDIQMAWSRQIDTDAALAAAANNDGGQG